MFKFVEYKYLPNFTELPKHAIIRFTKVEDLCYFDCGNSFISRDKGGSEEGRNRIMSKIGQINVKSFASTAVCHNEQSYENLKCYGSALLIFDKQKLNNDGYIFNGDVQDLSKIADPNPIIFYKNIAFCQLSDPGFDQFIDDRCVYGTKARNMDKCNLVNSKYFECRIFRPLTINDVIEIYAPALELGKIVGDFHKYLEECDKCHISFDK